MKFITTFLLFTSMLFAQPTLTPNVMEAEFGRFPTTPVQLVGTATFNFSDPLADPFFFKVEIEEPYGDYVLVQSSGFPTPQLNQTIWVYVNTQTFPAGEHEFGVTFVSLTDPEKTVLLTVNVEIITNDPPLVFPEESTIVVPHIALSSEWKTKLVVSNQVGLIGDTPPSSYRMKFYDSDGEPLKLKIVSLPRHMVPNATGYSFLMYPNYTESFELLPTEDGLVVGSVYIETLDGNTPVVNVEYDNGVDVASVQANNAKVKNLSMQYNNLLPTATGVALANSLNQDQTVLLEFFDQFGFLYSRKQVVVPGKGRVSFMLTDFVETIDRSGYVTFDTTYPTLSGFGLIFDVDTLKFYTTAVE